MYKILFTTFFIFTLLTIGCGGPPAANGNRTNSANGNLVNANTNVGGIPTNKKEVGPTTNDAPTFGPIVRTYYEALRKKDDALLKTVISNALREKMEAEMKAEKKKGLAAYMAELDRVPDTVIEVRNEKIDGDRGTAELKGGAYVNWSAIGFVKEDGKWKMSNESPEIESVKSSAPSSSNTAK